MQSFDDDSFFKIVQVQISKDVHFYQMLTTDTQENLYCDWLCRACKTAEIYQRNTSSMNRFVRTAKSKESCCAYQHVVSDGRDS
jgi:hypothetical protein